MSIARFPIATRVSSVALPRCGSVTTFSSVRSAGVTAGSFLTYPSTQRVTICEIEPLIPKIVSTYFKDENYNVVNDPRTKVVFDDARHYVLTSDEQFDIITSDPINPWVKGAATLYTREYFEMCKQHLAPGGMRQQREHYGEVGKPALMERRPC